MRFKFLVIFLPDHPAVSETQCQHIQWMPPVPWAPPPSRSSWWWSLLSSRAMRKRSWLPLLWQGCQCSASCFCQSMQKALPSAQEHLWQPCLSAKKWISIWRKKKSPQSLGKLWPKYAFEEDTMSSDLASSTSLKRDSCSLSHPPWPSQYYAIAQLCTLNNTEDIFLS